MYTIQGNEFFYNPSNKVSGTQIFEYNENASYYPSRVFGLPSGCLHNCMIIGCHTFVNENMV